MGRTIMKMRVEGKIVMIWEGIGRRTSRKPFRLRRGWPARL